MVTKGKCWAHSKVCVFTLTYNPKSYVAKEDKHKQDIADYIGAPPGGGQRDNSSFKRAG